MAFQQGQDKKGRQDRQDTEARRTLPHPSLLLTWCVCLSLTLIPRDLATARRSPFSAEKASFSLVTDRGVLPYRINSVFVMPGELLRFQIRASGKQTRYLVKATGGEIVRRGSRLWQWQAPPRSGLYRLTIRPHQSKETMRLNAFVMVPARHVEKGFLNGYQIGAYPDRPLRGQPIYGRPPGFIEITSQTENTYLTPHFQLKQFVCKQEGRFPKYAVLREELLLKLELILETLNTSGYYCETLHVMSGYRTPHYNRSLGNVQYSRHVWGGAADIFIDEYPCDGEMDDLNHDGLIDPRDAAVLYKLIESAEQNPAWRRLRGGLAIYGSNAFHGPFVHVDTRGQSVRWGLSPTPSQDMVGLHEHVDSEHHIAIQGSAPDHLHGRT